MGGLTDAHADQIVVGLPGDALHADTAVPRRALLVMEAPEAAQLLRGLLLTQPLPTDLRCSREIVAMRECFLDVLQQLRGCRAAGDRPLTLPVIDPALPTHHQPGLRNR